MVWSAGREQENEVTHNKQDRSQDHKTRQMEAALENRYRAIGIQAVAAAKCLKATPKPKQDDRTAARLAEDATD